MVSTIELIDDDALALNLAKTKRWSELDLGRLRVFAERAGADPERALVQVRETVQKALDLWPQVRREASVSALLHARLEAHWKRTPIIAKQK